MKTTKRGTGPLVHEGPVLIAQSPPGKASAMNAHWLAFGLKRRRRVGKCTNWRIPSAAVWIGIVAASLGFTELAQAKNPDTMTMTVSVNPASLGYGVAISSPELQGYDFGAVDVAATTISTLPIAVQNTGSVLEFFSVGVQDITNTYAWTNNGASLTPGSTSYVMQALLVDTGADQPAAAAFSGASNNAPTNPPVIADAKFNQASGVGGMTGSGSSKDLWLQLKMPTGVVETGVHTLVLTVNGQSI